MASATAGHPGFLDTILLNMTPEQLASLIATATELTQHPVGNVAAPASAANVGPTVRTSVLRRRRVREGKRRPLNSFIAFRSK